MTDFWNSFSVTQRVDIRNYVLGYLASNGTVLKPFVVTSLIQLCTRITKLGWFDDARIREITQEITKFLQATVPHCIIGLMFLNQLIDEMKTNTPNRTLSQHRRIAAAFRDPPLFHIFQISLTTLNKIVRGEFACPDMQLERLLEEGLRLSKMCLSFDFLGSASDEASDDLVPLQVPASWRNIMEQEATIKLFVELYHWRESVRSAQVMECLVQFASVRRSLFSSETSRGAFLSLLISAVMDIMRTRAGLDDPDTYHELCRLFAALKANHQLLELINAKEYPEFIELLTQFSVDLFQQWKWSEPGSPYVSNCVYYVLHLWSRLIASLPYLKPGADSRLEQHAPRVTKAYLDSRLEIARLALDGSADDPLEERDMLMEQLDVIPSLARCEFESIAEYLLQQIDPRMGLYAECTNMLRMQQLTPDLLRKKKLLESELAWLTYMVGAIINGRSSSTQSDTTAKADAELSARIFQLSKHLTERLNVQAPQNAQKDNEQMALAMLYFLNQFKRSYVGDQAVSSSRVFSRLSELMGLSEAKDVLEIMVQHVCANLSYWRESNLTVTQTLTFFHDLAMNYTGRFLIQLDSAKYLVANHVVTQFPFANIPSLSRMRTLYYRTVTRLFHLMHPTMTGFEEFLEPFVAVFNDLVPNGELVRSEDSLPVLIGLVRDLRGVLSSCTTAKTYVAYFEWLFPQWFELLHRATDVWWDRPAVTSPVLKFMSEVVQNKDSRIAFATSSPNGILLFREASKCICSYAGRIIDQTYPADRMYSHKYKGINVVLVLMTRVLTGGYVYFGVFGLYNDRTLDDALTAALQLILSIPLTDVMAFQRVARDFYAFIDVLCSHHVDFLVALDPAVFGKIVEALAAGLQATDMVTATRSCSALDNFMEFYVVNRGRTNKPIHASVGQRIEQFRELLSAQISVLFNRVIFEECSLHWSMSRPMLALILAFRPVFDDLRTQFVAAQDPDKQEQLAEAFDKLMTGVEDSLEPRLRDRFTQSLTVFRHKVRAFL